MKKESRNNVYELMLGLPILNKCKMTDKSLMGREYRLWNKYKKVFGILDYFSKVYTEERRIKKNEKDIKINKKNE